MSQGLGTEKLLAAATTMRELLGEHYPGSVGVLDLWLRTADALRQEREWATRHAERGNRLASELDDQYAEGVKVRAAFSRAEETIERTRALILPIAEQIDRDQIGTHGPDCHLRHRDCLVLAIERALTEYDEQKEGDRGQPGS